MRILPALLVVLAAAAGCSSQTTVENKQVTDSAMADGRRRAELHTSLAAEYYSRGNYTVALAETRLALKDDSSYFQAYNMQGLVYMELHEDAPGFDAFLDRAAATLRGLAPYEGWHSAVVSLSGESLTVYERNARR